MKRILLISGLLAILGLAAGCRIVDESRMQQDDHDRMPWNSRAEWEDQSLGVPY